MGRRLLLDTIPIRHRPQDSCLSPKANRRHTHPADLCGLLLRSPRLRSLDSRAIIQFSLLQLILTAIVRVVFSVVAFLLQEDRFYVLMALVVLAVLLNLCGE